MDGGSSPPTTEISDSLSGTGELARNLTDLSVQQGGTRGKADSHTTANREMSWVNRF